MARQVRAYASQAELARHALVDGEPGLVLAPAGQLGVAPTPTGRPGVALTFRIAGDRIVGIDVLLNRSTLAALDLAYPT